MTNLLVLGQLYEIVESAIAEESTPNESLRPVPDGKYIRIDYARVENGKLYRDKFPVDVWMLQRLTIPTVRLITKETINFMRDHAEVV